MNHFNLALSLLIGLIIFASSIESAKNNEVCIYSICVMHISPYTFIGCLWNIRRTYALLFPCCFCMDVV